MITNTDRAEYAAAACRAYEMEKGGDEIFTVIVDLIADLLHLASREGVDPERCVRLGVDHYERERLEESAE
jgi:hypothetical protein